MNEDLELSAKNFGFDVSWITDILNQYGEDVLALATEAARNGFSISLVVEILQKFGPKVLDFLVSLMNHKNMKMAGEVMTGDVVIGDSVFNASFIDMLIQKYLPMVIEQYLPQLLQTYGPQLVQIVTDIIMKYIQNLPATK